MECKTNFEMPMSRPRAESRKIFQVHRWSVVAAPRIEGSTSGEEEERLRKKKGEGTKNRGVGIEVEEAGTAFLPDAFFSLALVRQLQSMLKLH
jgi:hypothetical protein